MDVEHNLKLVERRFPSFPIHRGGPVRSIQDGWDSLVLDLGGEYILRFPRRAEVLAAYPREIALLKTLGRFLPTPVPQPEIYWLEDGSPEESFMGYPRLPGKPLDDVNISSGLAVQLGEFLSSLHDLPEGLARQAGVTIYSPASWRAQYVEFYDWVRQSALPRLPEAASERWSTVWEAYLHDPACFEFGPVLIHGDLGGEHILVDSQTGMLTGVIDWEDACMGDPALDFVGLLAAGGPHFVQEVLQSYRLPSGPVFWKRMEFYYAIIPFHELRFAVWKGDELMLARAITKLS